MAAAIEGLMFMRPLRTSTIAVCAIAALASCAPGAPAPTAVRASSRPVADAATATPAPASVATPTPAANATPAPTPTPTLTPAEARAALRDQLGLKLLGLAKLGFVQAQATLLSNNGAGVISNNGAGVISNNAGNLISDKGGGYRVLATPAITATALAGEVVGLTYLWADNSRQISYIDAATFDPDRVKTRVVDLDPAGVPVRERRRVVHEAWPSKLAKDVTDETVQAGDDGRFLCALTYRSVMDEAGRPQHVTIPANGGRWDDAVSGLRVTIEAFSLSFPEDRGSYTYRYDSLGVIEKGGLTKLRRSGGDEKVLALNLLQPESLGDVTARVETLDGALLYLKDIRQTDAGTTYQYDMQGGFVLRFDQRQGNLLTGKLLIDGAEAAEAKLERSAGAHVFTITFPDEPQSPMTVGFGKLGELPSRAPAASWTVSTVAGAATAGVADGAGATARFKSLAGLVASRLNPRRFYAADQGAHTIRVIDVASDGSVSVSTYAGTGSAGAANGTRQSASFNTPVGLAVAADDTLYVADAGNRRVRVIDPDGAVRTYAGSGQLGSADGPAASATFAAPSGLALDAQGRLYVADSAAHVIRRIATDGTVSTVAGQFGVAGRADGTDAAARFDMPYGLAISTQGHVLVADAKNCSLRQLTAEGVVTTLAGHADPDTGGIDGPALQTAVLEVRAIALSPTGVPYLGAKNVRMLRPDGQIGSYAGIHSSLHLEGLHTGAGFTMIGGMAFGPGDVLYVCDGTRLRAVTPRNAPRP